MDGPTTAVGEGGAADEEMEAPLPAFSEAFESLCSSQQQLQKCVVKLDSLTEDGTGSLVDGVLDLEFLDQLRTANDFLPPRAFVRQEMRTMFTMLVSKYEPEEEQRVLVGSPGIGKSVLFFLAALRRVVVHGEKVIYVRKTRQEMKLSINVNLKICVENKS